MLVRCRLDKGRGGQSLWHYPSWGEPCMQYTQWARVWNSFQSGYDGPGDGTLQLYRNWQRWRKSVRRFGAGRTGNLYGTTAYGGGTTVDGGGAYGYGTVFEVSLTGHETVLYTFIGTDGDGANPMAGLVMDAQGNLYGTTAYGGAYG